MSQGLFQLQFAFVNEALLQHSILCFELCARVWPWRWHFQSTPGLQFSAWSGEHNYHLGFFIFGH